MIVIGLAGYAGSGKTTVAEYLKHRYGFEIYTFSEVIEREALKMGLLRETQSIEEKKHALSYAGRIIRERYGRRDVFAEIIANEIAEKSLQKVCVDGFRSVEEVNLFRRRFENFLLLFVHAEPRVRYERRKRQDKNMRITFEEFLRRDEEDKKVIGMDKMKEMADRIIDNSNGIEKLRGQIDELMKQLGVEAR